LVKDRYKIVKKYKKLDYNTKDLESLSTSDLKKVCDYSLRHYLLANQESTYYFCPLKEKNYSTDKMHVAHFYDRGIMSTRYDLNNCHLISSQSNTWDSQIPKEGYKSLHHYEYEIWLHQKLGEKKFKELLCNSKKLITFAKEDYIKLIKKFRDE